MDDLIPLLVRAVEALEESNRLTKAAQKDWRTARDEGRANHKVSTRASARLHNLLEGQAKRQASRDRALDLELARAAKRDAEQTALLRAAQERQAEQHELLMHKIGARAPETVPPDWTDDDAVA